MVTERGWSVFLAFGKFCLFVIGRSVACVHVCIKIQVVHWFFVDISQQWSRCDEYVKARSHDPILRIRFLVPKIGSRRSDEPISRFRFCGKNVGRSFVVCSRDPIFRTDHGSSILPKTIMQNLSALFIFQEECRMKIKHVLFPSVFQNYGSMCRQVIFNVFTRSDFRDQQKSDP